MGFYVPWVIDGSKHPARLFRRTYQQHEGEGSGVSRPGDLKVEALTVPGTGFRVAPGGGVAQSRDTSGSSRESYGPINDQEIIVSGVPGTGSSGGRRDLVILEITDPEMESVTYPPPADPRGTGGWLDGASFCRITVIPGVGASVTRLEDVSDPAYANVTGVTLAAINWPASTGTITAAMIEDLREVHRPKSDRVLRTRALSGVESDDLTVSAAAGQTWPGLGSDLWGPIKIPSWATHVRGLVRWNGVLLNGDAWGDVWLRIGTGATRFESTRFDSVASGGNQRTVIEASGGTYLPVAMRGTEQRFYPIGRKDAGSAGSSVVRLDKSSSLTLDVEFYQATV
ncbi:hypothetical protein MUN78_16595 [Leucobacter allii]|uniref:Minor tail protein n=1 Tax=Leucobacter allii TaxID=2932247 RepID=A0ABY4FLW3_9MICO|nr:hypothetical protein [Leucobacter allii]UOQ57250.1 hypothetical protein MUN78_16595 [Leucobacter allii]